MIVIERLTSAVSSDVDDINSLGASLKDFSGSIDTETLKSIVSDSENYVQLVAREDGRIVGAATLSIVIGAIVAGKSAYLQDFVVSPEIQGKGIGSQIWEEMLRWCKEKNIKKLEFTSRPSYKDAHKFYEKRGAVIRETDAFRVDIP